MTPERRSSILDPFVTELGLNERAEAIESLMADLVRANSAIDALRAEVAKLREAAGNVLKGCCEVSSQEWGKEYYFHGEAIDALRAALKEDA